MTGTYTLAQGVFSVFNKWNERSVDASTKYTCEKIDIEFDEKTTPESLSHNPSQEFGTPNKLPLNPETVADSHSDQLDSIPNPKYYLGPGALRHADMDRA
ncbi:hypothetical protein RF11_05124 [Thelohanellus kitauei]|uniref:Uncharacterized protein n=1 Tax=Thelohanellus kitauei TaxID=669202 RepID=A0A0C2MJU0_THEKT|nr:hypothetical protein RF11_05124 [Thelohanellus kitauei]